VDTFVTAPAGARIHGGRYTVPERLGGKTIHPLSDFLLHDVGTGDGIVQSAIPQSADQSTANINCGVPEFVVNGHNGWNKNIRASHRFQIPSGF